MKMHPTTKGKKSALPKKKTPGKGAKEGKPATLRLASGGPVSKKEG